MTCTYNDIMTCTYNDIMTCTYNDIMTCTCNDIMTCTCYVSSHVRYMCIRGGLPYCSSR